MWGGLYKNITPKFRERGECRGTAKIGLPESETITN